MACESPTDNMETLQISQNKMIKTSERNKSRIKVLDNLELIKALFMFYYIKACDWRCYLLSKDPSACSGKTWCVYFCCRNFAVLSPTVCVGLALNLCEMCHLVHTQETVSDGECVRPEGYIDLYWFVFAFCSKLCLPQGNIIKFWSLQRICARLVSSSIGC